MSKKPKTINPDEVDPSIYYYDEVYDEMKDEERSEKQSDVKCDKPKGSKYIQGLIDSADQRKADKELRKFKKFAKDREDAEADGDLDDSDVYITPTYKRKLEEIKRIDEAKKRRMEREKDNVMNFLITKTKPDSIDEYAPEESAKDKTNVVTNDDSAPALDQQIESQDEESEPVPNRLLDSETLVESKKKVPKTREERKEYLRQVLAKRTVGKIFDEALQRYQLRKGLSTAL